MISYYTRIQMNKDFNKDILFDIVINWLETTRNKMEGLSFVGKIPFEYETDKKKIIFDSFFSQTLYTIQFTTTANRKNAQFVVEIIYHIEEQWLDLYFNKELTENSQFIPGTNIPGIFKQLLTSEYLLNPLNIKPIFISYSQFKQMTFNKPIVVLGNNKRCCVSPFKLADNLLGLAEVVCIYTKQEPYIKIIDNDNNTISIPYESEKETIRKITERLITMLNHQYQPKTYDVLVGHRLHDEHQSTEQLHEEMILETQELVEQYESEYEMYKEYYEELLEKYHQLNELNNELDVLLKRYRKEYFLKANIESYKEEEAFIMDLLNKELKRLVVDNKKTVFRRRDIINSLMEVNMNED